jgi:hypothetical protein
MKATELRIGNLVNINEETRIDNTNELPLINPLFKIERIDEDGEIIIYSEINNLHIHCDLESIQPIPLTEEWLFKFGFHLRDGFSNTFKLNIEKHQYDCSEITYSEKEGLLRFSNGKEKGTTLIPHIKHVHQLQNLYFSLTGEELTIKQQ